jgi:hypothetical protein
VQRSNQPTIHQLKCIGSSAERLKQRIKMKAQREIHKENRKSRRLELKAEHAKQQHEIELQKLEHARQQQAIELQKLELQQGLLKVSLQSFRRGRIRGIIR